MSISKINVLRSGLMGFGKPDEKCTQRQLSLRLIIMGAPLRYRFEDRALEPAELDRLYALQEQWIDARRRFVVETRPDRLIELAGWLVDTQARLNEASTGWQL